MKNYSEMAKDLSASRDRITNILKSQAQPTSFVDDMGDISQSLLAALSGNSGAAGFQQAYQNAGQQRQQKSNNQLQVETSHYKLMQDQVNQGNEDAIAVDKAIKDITGNDIKGYEAIANILHQSPDKIGPHNATMAAAKAANQIGFKPLGLQADRLSLQKTQAEINKLNAEAAKRNKDAASGMTGIDPILARQVDKDVIIKGRQASDAANSAARNLDQLENSLKGVETGKTKEFGEKIGQYIPFVDSSKYQDITSKSTKLSLDVASMLKGQTSDKDVSRSLDTVPGYDKDPEANKRIIKDQKAALKVVSEMPRFTAVWRSKYGSTIATDEQGKTYDEAFLDWQAKRFKELGGIKDTESQMGSNDYKGHQYKIR
jgi:hypothetical protein